MNTKIPIGVLGCGAISQIAHVPAALRAKNVKLAALCDRDPTLLQRVADKAGVEVRYSEYEEMLASAGIHAVVIAAPDPLHVPLAMQALRAGKHVLVEKPLAATSLECNELLQLIESTNLKLQVGCMKRHDRGIRFARQQIKDTFGHILTFGAVFQDTLYRQAMQDTCLDPLVAGGGRSASPAGWRSDRRHYNLFTQGAHLFDMLHFLVGPIATVQAVGAELEGNYSWHGVLTSESGAVGHFELSCKVNGDWREQYWCAGAGGSVEIDVGLWFYHRPAKVRLFAGDKTHWTQPLTEHSNMFANQLDAFAMSIEHDQPTNPDVRDGISVMKILEAVEASVRSGRTVAIKEMP